MITMCLHFNLRVMVDLTLNCNRCVITSAADNFEASHLQHRPLEISTLTLKSLIYTPTADGSSRIIHCMNITRCDVICNLM